jgi:hypothetical protein
MSKTPPTDAQREALADAMVMVLNDLCMGGGVCDLVQAYAVVAVQPFLLEDYGDIRDIEWAREVIARNDRQ